MQVSSLESHQLADMTYIKFTSNAEMSKDVVEWDFIRTSNCTNPLLLKVCENEGLKLG